MSYAIRNDKQGWRAVSGPDDVGPDETFSVGLPADPIPLPRTIEELAAAANILRDSLLVTASLRIAPLQDAVDLGSATGADTADLKLWKQYRVAVNRVSEQAGFPATIDWPAPPV